MTKAQVYAEKYEPGCLQYRISHDQLDKHKVCVFEVFVRCVGMSKCSALTQDKQEDQAALDVHIATDVSKNNVAFYAAGGLARPLEEQDIRVYTEFRSCSGP